MQRFYLSSAAFLARVLPSSLKQALYRIKPLARLIRTSLNRAAPQGLTVVTLASGGAQGMRMRLDLQAEKDYWLGTYEPELQKALETFTPQGGVVYDLGANIGYVTLLAARFTGPQGKVHAFEALPENQIRLIDNISLNNLQGQVTVFCGAVVGRGGDIRFLVGPSGGTGKTAGSAGRKDLPYVREIQVPGISLDEYVLEQGHSSPDLVKMDIEGGEVLALPGMQRVLSEVQPVILMELHGPEAGQVAWKTIAEAGYRLHELAPGYPEVRQPAQLNWKAYLLALPPENSSRLGSQG